MKDILIRSKKNTSLNMIRFLVSIVFIISFIKFCQAIKTLINEYNEANKYCDQCGDEKIMQDWYGNMSCSNNCLKRKKKKRLK